jgi:hypothetical protein
MNNATCNTQTQQCIIDYGFTSAGSAANDNVIVWSGCEISVPSEVTVEKLGIVASAGNGTVYDLALYTQTPTGMGYIVDTGPFTLANGTNEVALPFTPLLGSGLYWIVVAHQAGSTAQIFQSSTMANCVASTMAGFTPPNPFPAGQVMIGTPWNTYLVGAQFP